MDFTPDIDTLSLWLVHYGGFVLFALLTIGIIAFPVPEETLMVIAGVLMHKGKLNIPSTVIATFLGCLCGITVSYILGRTAGAFLIKNYGSWIGLTERRLKKAHAWFERFGKWALFIGYFIPGVRHFTGLSAGTSHLSYKQFALYAYSGAVLWATTFLSIGYFFGKKWLSLYEEFEIGSNLITVGVILAALCLLIYLYKKFKK